MLGWHLAMYLASLLYVEPHYSLTIVYVDWHKAMYLHDYAWLLLGLLLVMRSMSPSIMYWIARASIWNESRPTL
jgi:hypothetical protein